MKKAESVPSVQHKAKNVIMKKSYLWLFIGLVVSGVAAVVFIMNMRLSIQFTGGLEMTIDGLANVETLTNDLTTSLQESYPWTTVGVQPSPVTDTTSVLLNIDIQDDNVVQDLSESITQTLIDNNYIQNEEGILSKSLNWPSVSDYIKTTAVTAIVVGLLFMIIYILISFREIRHALSPALLALVVFVTMLFDIAIPAWAYGLWMMISPITQVDMNSCDSDTDDDVI